MPYRYRILSLLFLLSIITYLDRVCISVSGKRMQDELSISTEQWGWVVGLFTLSYAAFEIPAGVWGDKYGPRNILTRIVLWWSAFTAMTGLTSNYYVLLVVRFLFGAGEAGAYPNISAMVSRWFPTHERARAVGITWMASRLGGAISPLLVVPIQQAYGWRSTFYIFGAVGVVWCVWWWLYARDNPREKAGVSDKELELIGAPKVAAAHVSLPWKQVMRSRNFWMILAMYHTYCWGSYFYLGWLHTYLQRGRGFSEDEMKLWSTLPFLFGACGNLFGGLSSDFLSKKYGLKIGRRVIGSAGLALSGLFMLGTSQVESKELAVVFLALGYGCMDCMLPVSWAVCMDVGKKYAGAVSGSMNMAGQVGSFLSTVLFGYMVTWFGGSYNKPLIPLALCLLVSAFLFTLIDPTKQLVDEKADAPKPDPVLA
ncbi:MAG: MFS transporter [Bryobacterales bacterium]|nr:MFS transporter [Bryobacterales bacterium]